MYLTRTRLNLSYDVGMVNRYMENPTMMHHQAVKHILHYVKRTTSYGLKYQREQGSEELDNFTDNDLAGVIDDIKTTS